ncbi:MAG TPA: Fur family transcriptional regulator [Polyangiaceae bacterium]|nr:Fur family transcriptional regulator [Polyangiaceae bacterium]
MPLDAEDSSEKMWGVKGTSPVGRSSHNPDLPRLRRDLDAYMAKRRLRSTEQRRLIIDTLFDSGEHVTLDGLLRQVRAVDSRVGYATVYRTMKLLADSGIVQEHKFGDGFTRYELNDEEHHHDHLICLDCGKITEFEEPLIEELQARVAQRYDFQVRQHKHELYGICSECQKPKKRR